VVPTSAAEMVGPLTRGVARDLWAIYAHQVEGASCSTARHLVLPAIRGKSATVQPPSTRRRVSEQESRTLFVIRLDRQEWAYGIEVPTTQAYQQKGAVRTAGRTDLVVYRTLGNPDDRLLNIELKCGTVPEEAFRKDLEQLFFEGCDSLWWHVLMAPASIRSATKAMRASIERAMESPQNDWPTNDRSLWIAFLTLQTKVLRMTRITVSADRDRLATDLDQALARLHEAPHGRCPGWNTYMPTRHAGEDRATGRPTPMVADETSSEVRLDTLFDQSCDAEAD
jgi:hypothetical protein